MTDTILLTGAAGSIAGILRPALQSAGCTVRLTDRLQVAASGANEYFSRARLGSPRQMRKVCAGVATIIHLGAQPTESD